jgi:hypothetical protein
VIPNCANALDLKSTFRAILTSSSLKKKIVDIIGYLIRLVGEDTPII